MIYRHFQNMKLSALGMGCMRLPGDGQEKIDMEATSRMVAYAMEHGINYYDTAWGYHGGKSETAIGEILSAYPREQFYLASKFPGYDVNNFGKMEEIFEAQLKKCRVDYFDFYLFHNVNEGNIEQYLDEKIGVYSFLMKQKEMGRIRHLGFSCHGDVPILERFLQAYGDDMEFCQLQINYIDWKFQNGKEKVEMLAQRGIPVWVMEPLRGGKLAKLPEEEAAQLKQIRPEETPVSMAFRFLQSIPEVPMILSGMSDEKQMIENIKIFETDAPLNHQEFDTMVQIGEKISGGVPCTACRYCTEYCPMGIDIPRMISLYNEHTFTGGGFLAPMAVAALPEERRPSACISCGSCQSVCPQQIEIPAILHKFANQLKQSNF